MNKDIQEKRRNLITKEAELSGNETCQADREFVIGLANSMMELTVLLREDCRVEVDSPGKYEGEAPYVPWFDQLRPEEHYPFHDGATLSKHKITDRDRALFPELKRYGEYIYLGMKSDGLVFELDEEEFERGFERWKRLCQDDNRVI